MKTLSINGKTVTVHREGDESLPLIYINSYEKKGDIIALSMSGKANIVEISGLDWNGDMTPWPSLPVFGGGASFTGNAERYINELEQLIIPQAERITGEPKVRIIAGYSLAGLFALYILYKSRLFKRAASISGSLWYPGFKEYAMNNHMIAQPERIYISLGNRESRSRNIQMKSVEENSIELEKYFKTLGIRTAFELNEGNHFQNAEQRIIKALEWIIEE